MHTLETLCTALGFATLSGLNLYLVVFVAGLSIQQGWVDISTTYPDLAILGDPVVVTLAGVLFCLQFFSDKVPWVDSLWDSVHTLIRPVGGALLAITTLGPTNPVFEVSIGLLAGGASLVVHNFKAGTRLVLNASPEPVSNIVASVSEDAAVLAGLGLMYVHPLVAALLFLGFIGASLYLTPKLFRRVKAFFWLWTHKLLSFGVSGERELSNAGLTASEIQKLSLALGGRKADPEWSTPVVIGRAKRFPGFVSMTFGRIIVESSCPGVIHFVGRSWWRHYHVKFALAGLEIIREHRFLSEDVVFFDTEDGRRLVFKLAANRGALADRIIDSLRISQGQSPRSRPLTPADVMPLPSDRVMLAEESADTASESRV